MCKKDTLQQPWKYGHASQTESLNNVFMFVEICKKTQSKRVLLQIEVISSLKRQ